MGQNYIVVICSVLFALFAIWREVARDTKKNLPWRLAAVIVAAAAFACIILPINYNRNIDAAAAKQAILLTDGFNADSIPPGRDDLVYTLNPLSKKEYPKARLITSPLALTKTRPAFGSVNILGYGLNADELNQLDSLPVKFTAAKPPSGIRSASWNDHLRTGESLIVQGKYDNASADVVTLVLKGLGTTLDSTSIGAHLNVAFDLSTRPKNKGRAVYRLIAIAGKDTLSNNSIPLEVADTRPLNVLMLANTPDFENKFLKDWLTVNHYGVAMRTMISKDKYSQEFANLQQRSLGVLTPALLNQFDVVFATLDVLKSLKPAEAGALKQQVQQKGLGIIVRSDSTMHSAYWLQQNFSLGRSASSGQVTAAYHIQGQNKPATKLLADPVYIASQSYIQPLVTDQQNRAIAAIALQGAGREVFTTLNNSHNWMLSGNEKDYTAYWSLVISKAAKPLMANSQWSVATPVPYVNGHTQLQLKTSVLHPQVKIDNQAMPLVQQSGVPFIYTADYWPGHYGWQQAQLATDAAQWFYIYPANEWQSLKSLKTMHDTRRYALAHSMVSVTKQIHQKVAIAVSKIYFYVLLLLACTYLWAEAKFAV